MEEDELPFNPTDDEIDRGIADVQRAGPTLASSAANDNPENGVEAGKLSAVTGLPPTVTYNNLEQVRKQVKASMAADLVRNNDELVQYARSHPLVPIVSNDDWGNLDQFSRGAKETAGTLAKVQPPADAWQLTKDLAGGAATGAASGFKEGWGGEPFRYMLASRPFYQARESWPLASAGWIMAEAAQRTMSGIFGAVTQGAEQATQKGVFDLTGDQNLSQRLSREVAGITEQKMIEVPQHPAEVTAAAGNAARAMDAIAAAKPYIDAGVDVPRGVHPLWDEMKAATNEHGLNQLNTDLAAAQESLTRDRSSDMFQRFAQQHYGDAEIGVSGDAVASLYGDRTPSPGDGLLGWVPGIEDKLALARETGTDVSVPVADWVTKVDPAVAAQLNDHVRIWPGGITRFEGADPILPRQMIDAPLPEVRGAMWSEPQFALGDRKLTLDRIDPVEDGAKRLAMDQGVSWDVLSEGVRQQLRDAAETTAGRFGPAAGFHDFQLVNENGEAVGYLNLSQRDPKNLYVEMVEAKGGAQGMGPSLMRDLLKQIAAEFPEAETLSGHRVTGARDAANSWEMPSAFPKIDLRRIRAEGLDAEVSGNFRQLLNNGEWKSIGPNVRAYWKPFTEYTPEAQQAIRDVNDFLSKVAPTADFKPVSRLTARAGSGGLTRDTTVSGMHIVHNAQDAQSLILMSLDSTNPIGTAAHEAIHHLRAMKFFTPVEWKVLEDAATKHGWAEQFDIDRRYGGATNSLRLEEAIAEAYRTWRTGAKVTPEVEGVFQKLKQILDQIREVVARAFGRQVTWQDLFERVESGEVGARTPGERLSKVGDLDTKFQVPPTEEPSRGNLDSQLDALKASGMGLDAKSYGLLQDAIKRQYDADIAAAEKRALREQKKTQTAEWKANEKDVRKEIEERLRARPDIAADHFLGSGVLYGNKLDKKYKLLTSDLTDEQKAALGPTAHSKTGLPVDQVAKLFGFTSGDAMVTALARLREARGKLTPEEHLGQMTRSLASQEMERRYGSLDDNIMDAAKDQALSDASLDLMAQETYTAAQMANIPLVDKARMKAWVKEQFGKLTMAGVDSDRLMDTMAKHGRDAERQLIAGDSAGAVVSLQRKYAAALLAREARDIRKEKASFDRIAKRFAKREVKGIDTEYTNYIHQILQAVGQKVRRSVADLEKEIAASPSKDLETFVLTKSGMLRAMPVWPQLYDKSWSKEFPTLTTDEFRAVHGSLKTLVENGRNEQQIFSAGQAADLADIRMQMIANLKTFRERMYDVDGKPIGKVSGSLGAKFGRMALASTLKIETLLNRWDRFDPKGPFNQYVLRDLVQSAAEERVMRKEISKRIAALDDGLNLTKMVTNTIFREPNGDGTFGSLFSMSRAHLRTAMLNMGTESNLAKLAKGYGLTPDAIKSWVDSQASVEDWDFAQGVWNIFKDIKERSDTMYRSISGVPSQDIPARPINTRFGTYAGGYYPVIYHPEFKGTSAKLMGGSLEQEGYFHASPAAGYMESRTGYSAPMSLDFNFMAARLSQMIHDITMRPALINASKIFYDKGLQEAIRKHYGTEYRDQLIPYLQNVANGMNFKSKDAAAWMKISEFFRQNMISTMVGFNPGTVLKHGPTALVQSMREVGVKNFLSEMAGLLSRDEHTGENSWQFAMRNSQELQSRDVNWQETLTGATQSLAPESGLPGLRKTIQRLASKPVAISDLISAVPTWLAEYKKQIEAGEDHGFGVYMADRAVRRAHGSSAVTDRPGVMRMGGLMPWFTSVYNFFNHIANRQIETVWKAGDVMDLVKEGDYKAAMEQTWAMKSDLFAYVIAPALFEELVTPMTNDEHESWALKSAKAVAYTLSASWIFGRDIAHSILSGGDPSVGFMQTGAKEMKTFWDDLHKPAPMSKANAGKTLQDGATLAGIITGMVPAQVGREARAAVDPEHVRGPWGWLVKLRYGTLNKHSKTFDEWQRSYLH